MSSSKPSLPTAPRPSSAGVKRRPQQAVETKSISIGPVPNLDTFLLKNDMRNRSLIRLNRPWESNVTQSSSQDSSRKTNKLGKGESGNTERPTVDDCFVPYGPFPLPSRAAAAIVLIRDKFELTNSVVNANSHLADDDGKIEGQAVAYAAECNAFKCDIINALSIESDLKLLRKHKSSRSVIERLDTLFQNVQLNSDFLDVDDGLVKELRDKLFMSTTCLTPAATAQEKAAEVETISQNSSHIAFDNAFVDKKLDELDIKHRRLNTERNHYFPKPKLDFLDKVIDGIPIVQHVSTPKVIQMMEAEKSKLDMMHGDLSHLLHTLHHDMSNRRGKDLAKFRQHREKSGGNIFSTKFPVMYIKSEERDWLYSDLMVYSLENRDPNPDVPSILTFPSIDIVKEKRSKFSDALKHIALMHKHLNCPLLVHDQFWENHADFSDSNFAAAIVRLSVLHKAQ